MDKAIGEGGIYDIFVECLLYYLPKKYSVLYAPDVDIDRYEGVMNLMFESGTSLINNASTSYMKRHTKGIGPLEVDACVDVYDFQRQDFMAIKNGGPRVASALILADNGFGECAKMWCNGQRYGLLQIIEGVMRGAIIASMFGSMTSIHVEDGFLSTYNLMLFGVPKIWYIVPKCHSHIFQKNLVAQNLFDTVVSKNCYVKAFGEGRMVIPMEIVEKFEIARFVQYPGTIVMSIPGEIYHWAISCGFNISKSSNFFTTAAGNSL